MVKHFDAEVHRTLKYAKHPDLNSLFIWNHHFQIQNACDAIAQLA